MNADQPNASAARGLARLSKRDRDLIANPEGSGVGYAQVQSLRRSAVRALNQADRSADYLRQFGLSGFETADDPEAAMAAERARIAALRAKATDAAEACLYLNDRFGLGYPVQRVRRRP